MPGNGPNAVKRPPQKRIPRERLAGGRGVRKPLSWCALFARNTVLKRAPLFEGCAACPDRLQPLAARFPVLSSSGFPVPEFPVDAVYTWVDGADPALAAKRAKYLPPQERRAWESHGPSLYRDNHELRYSLRSLAAYAPWVRHIFIATDGQVPAWLNTEHEKIRIVDHRKFIPHEYLPTFSSRPIEAHLHRIPGLAEQYIFLNDDFFLAAPCGKETFFTANGLPVLFTDWRQSRLDGFANPKSPHTHSHANVRAYMEARGISPAPMVATTHAPYAQTLTNARAAYDFFQDAVCKFSHNKFRTTNDMVFYCHAIPLLAYAKKRAVPCDAPFYYINTKRFDRRAHYEALLRQKNLPCQVPFFCCNDVGNRPWTNAWRRDLADFLQSYYPEPSPFERRESAVAMLPGGAN